MAVSEDLWYQRWHGPPTSPGIPAMDMKSHLQMNGTIPKPPKTPERSPTRSNVATSVSVGAGELADEVARQTFSSPTGNAANTTSLLRASVSRVWNEATLSPAWLSAGKTFVSKYDAMRYSEKIALEEQVTQATLRRSQRASERTDIFHVKGAEERSPGSVPIILGRLPPEDDLPSPLNSRMLFHRSQSISTASIPAQSSYWSPRPSS